MQASDIPLRFLKAWAAAAGAGYKRTIPTDSQIGVQAGAASLNDGFPPVNFLPVGAGGTPPFGQDMNGILNWITKSIQWQQAGGPYGFNQTFATAVGGYPIGAIVAAATLGEFWLNTVDQNSNNPDTGGAGWIKFSLINPSDGVSAGEGIAVAGQSAIFTGSISGTTLNVSAVTSGALTVGMSLSDGAGDIAPGTVIESLGTGTGGTGTYTLSISQTISSRTITGASKEISLSFNSLDNEPEVVDSDIFARFIVGTGHRGITAAQLLTWILANVTPADPWGEGVGAIAIVPCYVNAGPTPVGAFYPSLMGQVVTGAQLVAGLNFSSTVFTPARTSAVTGIGNTNGDVVVPQWYDARNFTGNWKIVQVMITAAGSSFFVFKKIP